MLNFLIFFLLIFNVNFLVCSASFEQIKNSKSNLTQFVCDAVDEISKHKIETIAIVKFRNNFSSSFFDELHKCIPVSVTMVQLDLESLMVNVKVKNAKFVIVISDDNDKSKFIRLVDEKNPKQIFSHMSKFLFVSLKQNRALRKFSKILTKNGVLNFVQTFEDENGKISVEISNHFANTSEILKNIAKHEIVSKLYPDKLKNMHKVVLRVAAYNGMPEVVVKNNKVMSSFKYLVELFCEKSNATLDIKILERGILTNTLNEISWLFNNRKLDMTLSMIPIKSSTYQLVSYAESALCALIPFNENDSTRFLSLTRTFDLGAMIAITTSSILFMILWKIYRRLGEAFGPSWNVIFGLSAIFHGQQYNFRVTNPIMKFTLLITTFALFVMQNVYEASLTSQITMPFKMDKINSFHELFSAENSFKVGNQAHENMNGVPEYQKAFNSGQVSIVRGTIIVHSNLIQIYRCQSLERFLQKSTNKSYYMFHERLVSSKVLHEMGHYNPYTEYFQTLITRAYSAGLHKAWENFYMLETTNITDTKEPSRRSSLLNFEDMIMVMLVLPYGLIGAAVIFLMEIFYHETIARISWQDLMRKWAWNEKKIKTRIRRIQVRPINDTEF